MEKLFFFQALNFTSCCGCGLNNDADVGILALDSKGVSLP